MQRLLKRGYNPTLQSVNLLFSSLIREGRHQLLLYIFSQVSSNSVLTNPRTEALVARAFLSVGRFQEAEDIICRGQISNLSVGKLWDAFIRGVCGEDPEKGFALLRKCVDCFGVYPSASTFRLLVSSFCLGGKMDRAVEVLGTMTSQKVGYPLDNYVCTSIICGFYSAGKPESAINILENFWMDGDFKMYNDAIVLLCTKNCCVIAVKLYTLARKKKFTVSVKSYYVLLKCLLRSKMHHLVFLVLSTCIKEHGILEPRVVNILSLLLCNRNVNKVLQFIYQREKKSVSCSVSTAIVKSLREAGRIEDAYTFVMEAEDNLAIVDVVTYSLVVDGLCKDGYLEKALLVCKAMRNRGVQPNLFTYNSVINGLCQQGCLVEAFRIFDALESNNLAPTVFTYGTLIHALCREGYLEDAKLLFDKMNHNGIIPNVHVYNLLINGYCSFGLVEEACNIMQCLEKSAMKPDAFTISSVVNGFCVQGDMECALGFYTEYKMQGFTLDFLGYFTLIEGLYSKGRLEETQTIMQDMLLCEHVLNVIKEAGAEVQEVSLVSLLALLCEQGRIKDAIKVLTEVGLSAIANGKFSRGCSVRIRRLFEMETLDADNKVHNSDIESVCSSFLEKIEKNYIRTELKSTTFEFFRGDRKTPQMDDMQGLIGRASLQDFDFYYPVIASLCSRGELQKASSVLKHVVTNSRHCS